MSRRANKQRANRRQRQRYKTIVVPVGSLNPEVDNVIRLSDHLKHQPVLVVQQKPKGQGSQLPPPLQASQPPLLQLGQPTSLQLSQVLKPQAANPPLSKGPFDPVEMYPKNIPEHLAFRTDKEPQCKALTVKYRREDPDKIDSDDEEESTTEEEEEEEEGDNGKAVETYSKSKGLGKNESILCACSSTRLSQTSCISCTSSRLNMSRNSYLSCSSSIFRYDMPLNIMPSSNTSKPIYGILQSGFCRRQSKPPLPKAPFDANRSILYSTPAARAPPSIVHPIRNVLAQAPRRPSYYRHPAQNRGPSNISPVPPRPILFGRNPSLSRHKCDNCDSRKF